MEETRRKNRRLSQIMKENKYFNRAIESYLDQLRKKRDWQHLEKKLNECKAIGWSSDKIKKILQWERKAYKLHNESFDRSMDLIKDMASEITDSEFKELKKWIEKNSHSKEAWNKNVLSINDSISLIKAKIIHLAFMSRSPIPVNIGDLVNGKE